MKLSDTDIDTLLTDLSGKDAEKRKKAERFYSENKAEILPQFFAHLDRRVESIETEKKWARKFARYPLSACVIVLLLYLTSSQKILPASLFLIFPILLILTCSGVKELVRKANIMPQHAYMLNLLNELDDPRFIGYLIDLMIQGNMQVVAIILTFRQKVATAESRL